MVTWQELQAYEAEIIEIYKQLHRIPELGLNEIKTSALIAEKLAQWGIDAETGVARTGIVATIYGAKPGINVALRADMDALPITEATALPYASETAGRMHACGHDAHVAMLLGAAKFFSQHRELLNGNLRLIFQPAEEDNDPTVLPLGDMYGGAYYMIREGCLKDVDCCLAIHVDPSLPVGSLKVFSREAMASTDLFRILIQGKGGHGGAPHLAVDVIPALEGILSAIQTIIPREISPFETAVLSVGTVNTVSSVWNAIPGRVEISGTYRTYNNEVREHITRRLEQLAEHIPAAHRCTGRFEREVGYPATVNNSTVAKLAAVSAAQLLGTENVNAAPVPQTGGEDVGLYFKEVPGAFMFLGCSDPGWTEFADLHDPHFKISLDTLLWGTAVHINNVITMQAQMNIDLC